MKSSSPKRLSPPSSPAARRATVAPNDHSLDEIFEGKKKKKFNVGLVGDLGCGKTVNFSSTWRVVFFGGKLRLIAATGFLNAETKLQKVKFSFGLKTNKNSRREKPRKNGTGQTFGNFFQKFWSHLL